MTFIDYIKHYLSPSGIALFLIASSIIVITIHIILFLIAKHRCNKENPENRQQFFLGQIEELTESYYELIFSSSSVLFFVGLYFLIDYNYFHFGEHAWSLWLKYQDFALLIFIIISIVFNNIIDHILVPLTAIEKEYKQSLRMAAMIYMLIIFAYIKFIYQDDNYNTIVMYFFTLVIGRFVYFDASFKDFKKSIENLIETISILCLVLLSSALLSFIGFRSEYLLRSNGVVVSLFLAHFYVIIEILIIHRLKLNQRLAKKIHP